MRIRHIIGVFAVALGSASCSLGGPEDAGSLNVFVETNDSFLAVDDSMMTITVTARNVGYNPVTLAGPSDCLLSIEVRDTQGTVVWYSYRDCVGVPVTEELIPGQDKVQVFTWSGVNSEGTRVTGSYYYIIGVARLSGEQYAGPPLTVTVE